MGLTEAEELELLELEKESSLAVEIQPKGIGQTIASYARPALEIGGALGGTAIAGALSAPTVAGIIPASVAGGALGFAGGSAVASALERALGVKPPIASLPEAITETGKNISSGISSEALGLGMGKAAQVGGKAAIGLGKRGLSVLTGPSVKDINAFIANPAAIKNAKPFDVLARELPEDLQSVSDHVTQLSDNALNTLSPSKYLEDGAMAKDAVLRAIRKSKEAMGRTISDATSQAKKTLSRYAYRLKRLGNTVSEQELGSIIRDIDNDIDWAAKEKTPQNNALKSVRIEIDGILKTNNPEYAQAMAPVSEGVRLLKKAKSLFHVERDIGKGYKPTNMTSTALKSSTDIKRVDSRDILGAIKGITGRDYLQESEFAKVAENFATSRAAGSRRVNLGKAIGAGLGAGAGGLYGGSGAIPGAVVGALAGGYADTYGGEIAGSVLENLLKLRLPGKIQAEALARTSGAIIASKLSPNMKAILQAVQGPQNGQPNQTVQ